MKKWVLVLIVSIVVLTVIGLGLVALVIGWFVFNAPKDKTSTTSEITNVNGLGEIGTLDKGVEDPKIDKDSEFTKPFFDAYDVKGNYADGSYRLIYTKYRLLIENGKVFECLYYINPTDESIVLPTSATSRSGSISDGNLVTWESTEYIGAKENLSVNKDDLASNTSGRLVTMYNKDTSKPNSFYLVSEYSNKDYIAVNQYLPDSELSPNDIKNCFRGLI